MNHTIVPLTTDKTWSQNYRAALLAIGKSPDTHLQDLRFDFVNQKAHAQECRFLSYVRNLYQNMSRKQQLIFVYDILEEGRNYPFWYLGYEFRKGEYERLSKELKEFLEK